MKTLSRREFATAATTLMAAPAAVALGLRAARADTKQVKIALLLPGSVSDGGWDQLAYDGLKQLAKQPGFKVAHTEGVTKAQMEQAIRGYGDDGYDLIIGHSYEYGSAFVEIAPDFPAVSFFASTFKPGEKASGNVEFIDMSYLEASYGAGALAALISTKGKAVGFVGGGDNPTQQGMMKAFIAGAEHTVSGLKGLGIVTGNYDDAAKGREAATTMIGNDADVIWHAADTTGLGAVQGAAAAKVKVIGCYSDQSSVAPDWVATSFVLNLSWMVVQIGTSVQDGSFKGGSQWKPVPGEMWLFQAAGSGSYNPRLITSAAWTTFQAIWNDVNSKRIDVAAVIKG